jgi:integrase
MFLAKSKDRTLHPVFEMYFTYGLRRGKALGLRWCDVDFENKTIHIRQHIVVCETKIFVEEPKTEAGKRKLPLLPHIETMLSKIRSKLPDVTPDTLVFRTQNGTRYQPNNVYRTFVNLTKELGLPKICIHKIRHTVATMMKDNGGPIKDAQTTLGHSSIQTTMQIYHHSNLENKNTALQLINNAVMR